jgi:polyhydroxybutyrate depolymerase
MFSWRRAALRFAVCLFPGLAVVSAGCQTSLPERGTPQPGTYRQTTPLRYLLSNRNYLVHVPRGYGEDKTYPLVVMLHSAFSAAAQAEKWSKLSDLADREGFVVAYPNGIGLFGWLQHWNAGYCCGLASMGAVADVKFISYVIDDLSRRLCIDPNRVYVAGHSNGAMLAYYFASERPGQVAAIGVVSGSIGVSRGPGRPPRKIQAPQTPVPLIVIHGREDGQVPFEGGRPISLWPLPSYLSVLDSACSWAEYCGCASLPVAYENSSAREVLRWQDNGGRTWVILYVLSGWGHRWPGTAFTRRLPHHHPLRQFEASEVLWDFFRHHTRAEDGDGRAVRTGVWLKAP